MKFQAKYNLFKNWSENAVGEILSRGHLLTYIF